MIKVKLEVLLVEPAPSIVRQKRTWL